MNELNTEYMIKMKEKCRFVRALYIFVNIRIKITKIIIKITICSWTKKMM